MRDDLTQKLYSDFPDLFWQHTGFCCGDGWYDIIYRLSEKITALVADIPDANPKDFCAVQVKEKWGGLRFYMGRSTDEIEEAIENAEAESFKTCEQCGREGELRELSWEQTLCNECLEGGNSEDE